MDPNYSLFIIYVSSYDIDNPLSCGCDLAWILANGTYYEAVTSLAMPKCEDGTKLSDLDQDLIISLCQVESLKLLLG